jgi:predicted ATPase
VLHSCELALIAEVSEWLSNPGRLGTGYQLRVKHVKELDSESPLWAEMLSGAAARNPDDRQRKMLALPARREVGLATQQGVGDVHPSEVGIGVSQVLPVIVASLDDNRGLVCIEQPELHLHPRIQCELGDLLIAGTSRPRNGPPKDDRLRKTFIVETHSEHLILRILRRIRETSRGTPHDGIPVTPDDVSVVYVSQEDGQSVPQTIGIDEHGEFTRDWPDDFFESDFYERFS